MKNKIKALCYKYYHTNKNRFDRIGYDVNDLLQEAAIVEWQTKNKEHVIHNCMQHLNKLLEKSNAQKRQGEEISIDSMHPDELYMDGGQAIYHPINKTIHKDYLELTKEEQKESWIYPGIGKENIFEIMKTGNYNANSRFEYNSDLDTMKWRNSNKAEENHYHLYID